MEIQLKKPRLNYDQRLIASLIENTVSLHVRQQHSARCIVPLLNLIKCKSEKKLSGRLFNLPRLKVRMRRFFALSVDVTMVILKVGQAALEDSLDARECTLLDRTLRALRASWLCRLDLWFQVLQLEAVEQNFY